MMILQWSKTQIMALLVLMYVGLLFIKEGNRLNKITHTSSCNSIYSALYIISELAVLFDGITAVTVNYIDRIPREVNLLLHLGMFVLYENDIEFIDLHTERLLSEFLKYKEYLAPYFPDVKAANEKKKASEDEAYDLLDKMTAALEEMDTLLIDEVMEEFDTYEFDAAQNSFLEKLKKAAEEFDIDLCVDIVDEWKQSLI